MRMPTLFGVALLAAALFLLVNTAFIVDETKQALVLQLGQYVRTVQEPGLNFKIPFLQQVVLYERRLLRVDSAPSLYFSKDKKQLIVDAYARYRIVEPLAFFRAVRTETGAQARLADIVNSNLRAELAQDDQSDIVKLERNAITDRVTVATRRVAQEFGIEVIDVRIKRADFPEEIAQSIYGRMNAEREKEAQKFRSEGAEEEAKIKAEADKQRTILLAEARRTAQLLRGEGDAGAADIYARALEQDPEFYAFQRSLEAYKRSLTSNATLVLSADSDFFRYLGSPESQAGRR
ncbi:MAG: protease modulator HflC [Chloroflexi bacterium]|nr:protease modulator HflC [Chloroflexota bacterium]